MKIVCIWSGFFLFGKYSCWLRVTIRTINCYDRLNVLFLREKCSLHPSRYIFICIFFFFRKTILFQFYSCLSLYWIDNFGERFFFCCCFLWWSRSSCKISLGLSLCNSFSLLFGSGLLLISFFFFYCKETCWRVSFLYSFGSCEARTIRFFSFCFPQPLATTNAHQ